MRERYTLMFRVIDSPIVATLERDLAAGIAQAETALGRSYTTPFVVRVFSDRAEMTDHWRKEWNQPGFRSACWMVAAGWKSELSLLSPRLWSSAACDHDASNSSHVRLIVGHELVHVLHAQLNAAYPRMQAQEAWLPEGLATYASGQWDVEYRQAARQAAVTTTATTMRDLWASSNGYALAGSVVAFLTSRGSTDKLEELWNSASWMQVLEVFDLDEPTLIRDWKAWMVR